MADVFVKSGDLGLMGVPPPVLQGQFIPAIDSIDLMDGFGLVIPWGSGNTARRVEYGVTDNVPSDRLLEAIPGDSITYKFTGLEGPMGPPGPPGPRGYPGISAIGVTADPATHNLVSSTTDGSTAALGIAGNETVLESITITSRGNAIEITCYATFVSTWGSSTRTVTVRIYDVTGSAAVYTSSFSLTAGQTLYKEFTTIHTPGAQSNTYNFDASVDAV